MRSQNASEVQPTSQPARPWADWLRFGVPILLVIVIIAMAWRYLQPAPPGRVVIATGSKQGVYYAMATQYAHFFAENGIDLEVRETAGSAENFGLLTLPGGDVDLAIVQGGTAPPEDQIPNLRAVAGIYYEPVLVFTRGLSRPTQLSQLAGKKIAVGAEGSGVRVVALKMLEEAGVAEGSTGTSFMELGGDQAADALARGELDAAFFVISPDAPVVARLLETQGIHLMSFDQARAYGRRHPFLSATTLYQGAVDIKRNLPDRDIQLVASPATLVVRNTTHSAVIELLVRAAQEMNSGTTLLSDAGTFPTAEHAGMRMSKDALFFLKTPPGFLRRTLPFWLASMVDRLIILVVPLLVVLIPLIRMMPPVLKWRVQRKIFHRYKRVRQIEEKLHPESPRDELQAGHDELVAMDKSLATLKIPISFVEELYNLRNNVSYVRTRLESWLKLSADTAALSQQHAV
jgi:TRAP transporter TAXI family solute receptor